MRTPAAALLLQAWEAGRSRHPLDRGLLLFALAEPGADPETLAWEPLGRRNDALLRLRMATFGTAIRGYVDCPECDARMALKLDGESLFMPPGTREAVVTVDGLSFRLPTSRDLASVLDEPSEERSALRLLQLCSESADGAGDPTPSLQILPTVEEAMEEADPMAEIGLEVSCHACGNRWTTVLDMVEFLWEEIESYALRLLDEVHVLASAYGWTEEVVLSLSDTRRAAYIRRILA